MDHPLNLPPLQIPDLLRKHGIRLRKRLGQNFLIEDHYLQKIVRTAQLGSHDSVLEIGAGIGNLTRYLASVAGWVVAIEIDPRLIPVLNEVLAPFSNVSVVVGDILAFDPGKYFQSPPSDQGYVVVANIPYYITSAVIRRLLEANPQPRRLFLTMQREVAERLCAAPGDFSLLALSVQVFGNPEIAFHIPAGAFYPSPKVDSSLVQVHLYPEPRIPQKHLDHFFKLIKAGFSQKRKKLRNALAMGLGWTPDQTETFLWRASIDPSRRAESLTLDEWGRLATALNENSV